MSRSNTAEFINKAIAMTQEACDASAGASAELARAFHNEISSKLDRRTIADPTTSRSPEATENAVRSVGNPESDDRFDRVINRCCDRTSYEGRRAAGNTITRSARAFPGKVKFARVPMGFETCGLCATLASRGFVYASAKTAGQFDHYHPNCRCMAVPSISGFEDIDGYDPGEWYEKWKRHEKSKKTDGAYAERDAYLANYEALGKLRRQKQSIHIEGTLENKRANEKRKRKPSCFTISPEEVHELIKEHSGKGEPETDDNGKWIYKEACEADKVIGYIVANDGRKAYTRCFKIHYSKNGVHAVPKFDERREPNDNLG